MASSVLCIGVANVDVIAHVDTGFLVRHRIDKGTSTLMRAADILTLTGDLKSPVSIPGGCAANTACGVGLCGIETSFAGMIHDDFYGEIFRNGFAPYNVTFRGAVNTEKSTSLCLTLVTPDKERSFVFSPDAASWFLSEDNLPDLESGRSTIVYTEANLFRMTAGTTRQSMVHAVIDKYHGADAKIMLNLIDTEITVHQRQVIFDLIRQKKIACILSNIEELMALFSADTPDQAFEAASKIQQLFATTLGKDGAVLIHDGKIEKIEPVFVPHEDVQDLIGAGDQFAAGFIAGIAAGKSPLDAARQGTVKASEIILVPGARPKTA